MPDSNTQLLQFRPRARIIRTIGDQLISGPEAAVIELVKNAYDADASRVTVKFIPPLKPGLGRITISDDGHGMTLSDIQDKWMEPATSSKLANRKTPLKNRLMMGSKGIGRFAAAKLGGRMALNSISEQNGVRREILISELDWAIFDADTYLSDIKIDVLSQDTDKPTGTLIEISGLNESWSAAKLTFLHLELRRLISPLFTNNEVAPFDIFLDLSACTKETCGFDGAEIIDSQYSAGTLISEQSKSEQFKILPFPLLTACDYEVQGHFDDTGHFHGTFEIRRGGQSPEEVGLQVPLIEDEDQCGKVEVHLYLFDREADAIRNNMRNAGLGDLTAADARKILDNIAGVAVYRNKFRIRPYGDPANDWLTLDSRRVQNPSLRIGHNQVAGYIAVGEQDESNLIERSSREGFETNGAFKRLSRLIRELFAKVVEPKRQVFRTKARLSRRATTSFNEVREISTLNQIKLLIPSIEQSKQASAERVIDKQAALLSEKIDYLEERQRILEGKSSLGAIIGEVLHEGAPSAAYVAKTSVWLIDMFSFLFSGAPKSQEEVKKEFKKKLSLTGDSAKKLASLFANLRPLAGRKRGAAAHFNPLKVVDAAFDIYSGHKIKMNVEFPEHNYSIFGYPDDLSTALVNLIGNSIYWLENAIVENPQITIRLLPAENEVLIYVEDNGPGVPAEFVDSIFDVGFTLKDGGTGLGLNIAKETLARSGASLEYDSEHEGGAQFLIRFPR